MHEKTVDDDISVHLSKCIIYVHIYTYIHFATSQSIFGRELETLDFLRTGIFYSVI
jgi:hypothetical protein